MTRDRKGIELRRTVRRRLDHFFTAWVEQLASGSARIWTRVERTLRETGTHEREPAEEPGGMQTSPPMRIPMQQPMQHQKKKGENAESES